MSYRPESFADRRSPHARRGVVLIFVVAVLVLLAVIATTYLAMARADRVPPEIRGGLVTASGVEPYPTEEIRLDLFNWQNVASITNEAAWRYRSPIDTLASASTYRNFDFLDEFGITAGDQAAANSYEVRQSRDPWLASREPEILGTNIVWPKISRWLERWSADRGWVFNPRPATVYQAARPNANNRGFFESPLGTVTVGVPDEWDATNFVIPTYVRIDYPQTFVSPAVYAGKAAVYPALTFAAGAFSGKVFIAGDADGDGVADSGLFPLDTWQVSPPGFKPDGEIPALGYPGDANNHYTRWYAAIRVVDNNAQINVNTAWRRNADVELPLTGGDPVTPYITTGAKPNYGFFRSNIGLYELLPSLGEAANQPQWTEFERYRFNNVLPTETVAGRTDYVFSTMAEALEMNLARRPLRPGPDTSTGITVQPYQSFGAALSSNLAFMNGLINPRESRTALETAFILSLYQNVPNWGAADAASNPGTPGKDLEKESRSFTFFAAPDNVVAASGSARPLFWYNALYNRDEDVDNAPAASRSSYFSTIGAYSGNRPLPRTVRQMLTASNPLATTARPANADFGATPAWLSDTVAFGSVPMDDFEQGTRAKVGINTSTYGKLWRNFFLSMKDPTLAVGAPVVAAVPTDIDPNGRPTGTLKVTAGRSALYLRSALAAVNAIDQRDGDDTITTYRINLPGGENVMVAGAEQQLFISRAEVVPNTSVPGTNQLQVELFNPYDRALEARGYKVGFLPAVGGGGYTQTVAAGAVPVPAGTGNKITVTLPIIPTDTAQYNLVLLRTRRADGQPSVSLDMAKNPYSDSMTGNDNELVCLDMVQIPNAINAAAGLYQRIVTDWKLASTGTSFANAAPAVENPVALDNLPVGVARANVAAGNRFPLSGFPRDGDMLLIPYIGHYTFYSTIALGATVTDAVPITVDVQVVPGATGTGQITGRFTPILVADPDGGPTKFSFDWRARIFDNFTTLANPMSDALPNIAEESWLQDPAVSTTRKPVTIVTNVDIPVVDEKAPVQGLVNINTASERVLSMVPFVTNVTTGRIEATDVNANLLVAQGIVNYRRANGPFRSVIDILSVPEVQAAMPTPSNAQGNFYIPATAGTSLLMPATYATQFHPFVRVSNLLTTRSDSFTVYVLLQQWQDFGYPAGGSGGRFPLLLPDSEKRFSFIIDRSQLHDGQSAEDFLRKQSVSTD